MKPATETGPSVEQSAMADFEALMSGVGSETKPPKPAPRIKAREALVEDGDDEDAATDETPAPDGELAEDSNPTAGEETAGDPDEAGDTNLNPDTEAAEEEETPEAEAEDEGVDEQGKPWPKSYLRRLAREKEKRERAEERLNTELSTLKAEVEELRAKAPAPGDASAHTPPVTDDEQQWTGQISKAEMVIDFVEDNPEGATTPDGRNWTRQELREQKRIAERTLRDAEAKLGQSRQERADLDAAIKAELPKRHHWITDRTSPATVAVDGILRKYPVLKTHPLFRALVADSVAFEMQRQQAAAKAPRSNANGHSNGPTNASRVPAPPPPRPAARIPGRPGAVPAPVNGKRATLSALEQRAYETGDSEATKALLQHVLTG